LLFKCKTIKKLLKNSISITLVATVLLQFAIQFVHAFENHQQEVCHAQNKVHIDKHEIDCSVFHYKINNNTVAFSSNISIVSTTINEEKIYSNEEKNTSERLHFKSSRAPPLLLF
jgi:hypothetical protein